MGRNPVIGGDGDEYDDDDGDDVPAPSVVTMADDDPSVASDCAMEMASAAASCVMVPRRRTFSSKKAIYMCVCVGGRGDTFCP